MALHALGDDLPGFAQGGGADCAALFTGDALFEIREARPAQLAQPLLAPIVDTRLDAMRIGSVLERGWSRAANANAPEFRIP